MSESFQPLPVPDADTAPFWDACAQHRLVFQRCTDCGTLRFPPSPVCHRCRGWSFDWEDHHGHGRVHSWVVVHHAIPPSIAPDTPYVSALVELEEGVKMPARLVDLDPDEVVENLPVRVAFRDVGDGVSLPVFGADRNGGAAS